MSNVINHCDQYSEIQDNMSREDFTERVMDRAEQLINDAITGSTSTADEYKGIELVANSVARSVLDEGARRVSDDLGVNIENLKRQAASLHISFC